jgi:hypothetical protein
MAKPTLEFIEALRKAAKRIANKTNYNWKDIGSCNCGNLVQVVTDYSKKEISKYGIEKHGDWEMLSRLYKKNSKYKIDEIISHMLDMGMILDDFAHLENLSSGRVLSYIPEGKFLKRDNRDDVILYLNTWADMLERELLASIKITEAEHILEEEGVEV